VEWPCGDGIGAARALLLIVRAYALELGRTRVRGGSVRLSEESVRLSEESGRLSKRSKSADLQCPRATTSSCSWKSVGWRRAHEALGAQGEAHAAKPLDEKQASDLEVVK